MCVPLVTALWTLLESPLATLVPVSIVVGLVMLVVFRYTSNARKIKAVKARLWASIYEMLLFADEPALVWRAQAALLVANAQYIGLMLVPAIVLTLPMVFLFANLEAFYGRTPLGPGQRALVVLQLREPMDLSQPAPVLEAPPGVEIETPAVRVAAERQLLESQQDVQPRRHTEDRRTISELSPRRLDQRAPPRSVP